MNEIMKSLEWMINRTCTEYGISKEKAMEAIAISLKEGNYQENMVMDVFYVVENDFKIDKV